MTVYVDHMRAKFGRMVMCHMVADSLEELHAMADKIGVNRKWFQKNASTPHYDICMSKREMAVNFGAVEVDRTQLAEIIKRLRAIGRGENRYARSDE